MLNWTSFWSSSRYPSKARIDLSIAEKLAYLRHAVKDGTAKHVIEGLSGSGNNYTKAVENAAGNVTIVQGCYLRLT